MRVSFKIELSHRMLSCDDLLVIQHRLENPLPPKRLSTFYLRDEVSIHNTPDDAWVIVNGRVLDLTPFLAKPDIFPSAVGLWINIQRRVFLVSIMCFRLPRNYWRMLAKIWVNISPKITDHELESPSMVQSFLHWLPQLFVQDLKIPIATHGHWKVRNPKT